MTTPPREDARVSTEAEPVTFAEATAAAREFKQATARFYKILARTHGDESRLFNVDTLTKLAALNERIGRAAGTLERWSARLERYASLLTNTAANGANSTDTTP